MDKNKCAATVRGPKIGLGYSSWKPCSRKACLFENGNWWCKQHALSSREARYTATKARWKAENEAEDNKRKALKVAAHWSDVGPDLLAALDGARRVLRNHGYKNDGNSPAFTAICEAIAKAEGKS